jgi:hypothetical protein
MARLPTVSSDIPRDLRQFLERVRETIGGRGEDELVTVRKLVASGIADYQAGQLLPGQGDTGEYVPPPAPQNLQASGALANISLTWDEPAYLGHSYTEVWAAIEPVGGGVPDIGEAVMVGMAPGSVFAHQIGSGGTRWYWIKFVNIAGAAGPFNAVDGVQGETSPDPAYLLGLLSGQITESQLYQALGDRIDLVDGPETTTGSVAQRIAAEASARAQAISTEAQARIQAVLAEQNARQAAIQTESTTREASDLSEANARQSLATQLRGNYSGIDVTQVQTGLIHSERQSRITADSNLQQQIDVIVAASSGDFGDLITAVQEEATARISGDAAISSTVDLLTSRLDNVKDAAGNPTNKTVEATLVDDRSARVTGDSALASDIASLTTILGGVSANLASNYFTSAQTNSAIATASTTLQTAINGNTAAIQSEATARTSADGALQAQYTVKVETNGYVAGFGLASTANNATPTSEFIVRSDKFAIASPSGPGITPAEPFFVRTTPATINGVSVPTGVYIKDAFIQNGTITSAKIGNAAIDTAKITDAAIVDAKVDSLSAVKITTGFLSADRIQAGSITADKIDTRGLSIKDAAGNIILAAGTPLATTNISGLGTLATANSVSYSSVTGTKPPTNADNTASNVAAGITGQGNFATLDQITSANVSTYIASAAIRTAQIGDAQITTAKIGDLQVDTLKIANQAVSNTGAASGGFVSGTGWVVIAQVTLSTSGGNTVVVHGLGTAVSGGGGSEGTPGTGVVRIRVGSTVVDVRGVTSGSVSLLGIGTSSPVSTTIYLEAADGGGDGSWSVSGQLVATELKK